MECKSLIIWICGIQTISAVIASGWSSCSVTCGVGIQTKQVACNSNRCSTINRPCKLQVCPGYLSWPRIHMQGTFIADTATGNNNRCDFDLDHFVAGLSKDMATFNIYHKGAKTMKTVMDSISANWNIQGTNHFYFKNSAVRKVCSKPNEKCKFSKKIKVRNLHHGRLVDLDVDWQVNPKHYGLTLHIEGVLSAKLPPTSSTLLTKISETASGTNCGDTCRLQSVSTILKDIQWFDPFYQKQFKNATQLHFIFITRKFNFFTKLGHWIGTLGLSAPDDTMNNFPGRRMSTRLGTGNKKLVPFHIHYDHKIMVIDLTMGIDETFKHDKLGIGIIIPSSMSRHIHLLTLANSITPSLLWMNRRLTGADVVYSKILNRNHHHKESLKGQWINFLNNQMLSKPLSVFKCQGKYVVHIAKFIFPKKAYSDYGGILDVSLKHVSKFGLKMLSKAPVTLFNYNHGVVSKCKRFFDENILGLNMVSKNDVTHKMHRGDKWDVPMTVTKFGVPLENVELSLSAMKSQDMDCDCQPVMDCGRLLGVPNDVLQMSSPTLTNYSGVTTLQVYAVKSPNSPRKCNLDGQVYPLLTRLNYIPHKEEIELHSALFAKKLKNGVYSLMDAGSQNAATPSNEKSIIKECKLSSAFFANDLTVRVFDNLPKQIMSKRCPSWYDVRPFLLLYWNLFPSMENIIKLYSYEDVRRKISMLNMSMFEFDHEHQNFMPISRDLSPDKTEVIRRWIECEANGINTKKRKNSPSSQTLGKKALKLKLDELHGMLNTAIMLEWHTIPPYMNAWFSIKPGRSSHVADKLRSVYLEEMLHMSLAANAINSIGGKPNFTDMHRIPVFPCKLPTYKQYQLRPDINLDIFPYSAELARDIFAELEKPAGPDTRILLHEIASVVKFIPEENRSNKSFPWDKISMSIPGITDNSENQWKNLLKYSKEKLKQTRDTNTIASFYCGIMLRAIYLESYHQLHFANTTNKSIFMGNRSHQATTHNWYIAYGISSGQIFPVVDLRSFVEALLTIAYEGEGGSPCSPTILDEGLAKNKLLAGFSVQNQNAVKMKVDVVSPWLEKSHYIKFLELGKESELIIVKKSYLSQCVDIPNFCHMKNNQTVIEKYCYAGKKLHVPSSSLYDFQERPTEPTNNNKFLQELSADFNEVYVNSMICLEKAFNGDINHLKTCTAKMKEMMILGQQLVKKKVPGTTKHAYPTWDYTGHPGRSDGLRRAYALNHEAPRFC